MIFVGRVTRVGEVGACASVFGWRFLFLAGGDGGGKGGRACIDIRVARCVWRVGRGRGSALIDIRVACC